MSRQQTATRARAGKGQASRLPLAPFADGPQGPSSIKSGALLPGKYGKLIRKHLGKLLDNLFAEFTGVHFHVAWTPALPKQWDAHNLPTGCSACCRLTGSPLLPDCRICGPKQLARALGRDSKGHRFTCRLGVRNYWFPMRVRGETLGIAYLQALDHSTARPPARKRSARTGPHRLRRAGARVLSRLKFDRAARFLQLIVQHVQTASLSDLRKADLTSAGHAVLALEKEQARLHDTLQRHLPPAPQAQAPRRSGPESHAQQTVHCLLECIEQRYAQPIMLRQCAVKLGVNAAYASSLFSRAVGVPFKTYLTERRLEKAKELLGDPAKTASEVAQAVGYGSEDRFRIAFKKATGLSPKLWRATMQTNRPKPAPSTS